MSPKRRMRWGARLEKLHHPRLPVPNIACGVATVNAVVSNDALRNDDAACGERRPKLVNDLGCTVPGAMPPDAALEQDLCVDHQGFSLHAAVRCDADERQRLEQLCRYFTRPALANERV